MVRSSEEGERLEIENNLLRGAGCGKRWGGRGGWGVGGGLGEGGRGGEPSWGGRGWGLRGGGVFRWRGLGGGGGGEARGAFWGKRGKRKSRPRGFLGVGCKALRFLVLRDGFGERGGKKRPLCAPEAPPSGGLRRAESAESAKGPRREGMEDTDAHECLRSAA